MKSAKNYIRTNPHIAVGIPAGLSFISFISHLISGFKDGFQNVDLQGLVANADGFESVLFVIIAIILRKKNK